MQKFSLKDYRDSDNLILFLFSQWKSFVFGSVAVALVAIAGASVWPKTYSSFSVVAVTDAQARTAESLINTPRILDALISKFPDLEGGSLEGKRRQLSASMNWRAPPGENRRTTTLFYFSVEGQNPALAQQVNGAALDAWLELTKPGPVTRRRLEDQLERVELQLRDANTLIAKLEAEAPAILAPNSLQGELATPLSSLRTRRDLMIEEAVKLRQQLLGSPPRPHHKPTDVAG